MFEENNGGPCGWIRFIEERVAQDEVLGVVRSQIMYNLVSHYKEFEF